MHYTAPEVYEFISRKTGDPILEWRTCAVSGVKFPIFQSDKEFYDKISPTFGGKKYLIPYSTLCPEERQRRRMAFRNVHKLYKREDPLSEKMLITPFSPEKQYQVFTTQDWFSDDGGVDGVKIGRDFDMSKSFIENFMDLQKLAPRRGSFVLNSENCDWNTNTDNSKNCYMTAATINSENIYYSDTSIDSEYILDSLLTHASQHCAHNIDCKYSYKVYNSFNVEKCTNSRFLYNCVNCNFCIGCTNLHGQQYYILNKKSTKEMYQDVIKQLIVDKQFYEDMLAEFRTLVEQTSKVACLHIGSEKSFGNEIYHCKEAILSFNVHHCDNIKYTRDLYECKSSQDIYKFERSEFCYEVSSSYKMYHCLFCYNMAESQYCLYCETCLNCYHCFACVGLKNKKYCIFNKQYTKEEYEQQVSIIIEQMQKEQVWGEFFTPIMSPYGYNETDAMNYFPLEYKEALIKGYKWQDNDYDLKIPIGVKTLKGDEIPFDVSKVNDDILQDIFVCEISGRPFKIIKSELHFYHQHNLSLPRKHPDIRYHEKTLQRLGKMLYLRTCDKCGEEMLSVYRSSKLQAESGKQNDQQKVYCEQCYQEEVYG